MRSPEKEVRAEQVAAVSKRKVTVLPATSIDTLGSSPVTVNPCSGAN